MPAARTHRRPIWPDRPRKTPPIVRQVQRADERWAAGVKANYEALYLAVHSLCSRRACAHTQVSSARWPVRQDRVRRARGPTWSSVTGTLRQTALRRGSRSGRARARLARRASASHRGGTQCAVTRPGRRRFDDGTRRVRVELRRHIGCSSPQPCRVAQPSPAARVVLAGLHRLAEATRSANSARRSSAVRTLPRGMWPDAVVVIGTAARAAGR